MAIGRRGFLKGAAAGAALIAKAPAAKAQEVAQRNGGAQLNTTTVAADTARGRFL